MNTTEGLAWNDDTEDDDPAPHIERGVVVGVDAAGPEVAEVDLLIARPDLGPNSATFIRAGDAIPAVLVGRKRTPRGGRPPAAPPSRRKPA